jgi:hypothetical protein
MHRWLKPIILDLGGKIRRITVETSPRQIVPKILS